MELKLELEQRVAVVTGTGVGRGVARILAEDTGEGFDVDGGMCRSGF